MKIRSLILHAVLSLAFVACAARPASAKLNSLGSFGNWNAYADKQGGQVVCYMVATKTLASVGPAKRSSPYLMITHRPIEGSTDVVSYGAGALLNAKRSVWITIGKTNFDLFAVHDIAWTRDALTDHRLAKGLRDATRAEAKATPGKRGAKAISDVFDLTGASAAYSAINKACGLAVEKPKSVIAKKTTRKKTATPKGASRKASAGHVVPKKS